MSELRTNQIFPRDGKPAGAMGGGIIQVVRAQNTTSNQRPSSTSTWTDVTPTVTITPTRSSNLVIIETSVTCITRNNACLLYTSPSSRDLSTSRMPSSA